MISIQFALARGRAIRHCDWPPFHYAKLTTGLDGKRKLYRCYPDGHIEILKVEVSELRGEDGWLVEGMSPDGPTSAA